jgi:septal ring factor EnvC (AmiA/AmiB activator)
MEQMCRKHNQFKPCQQCALAAVWGGEALMFKRGAEREITRLRQELEEAKDEVSRLSDLWKSDVEENAKLEAEVERLKSALEKLEGDYDTALQWNIELEEQLRQPIKEHP